ncbi:MAG: chemotaxis protein CheW [Gammaproteobacteria bacterium]
MSTPPQTDPLSILRALENKARAVGIELPRQEEVQGYWAGVVFTVEGAKLSLPTNEMSEILTVPQCTRVPGAKAWVRGVANVRGTLLPILDLREFLKPRGEERQTGQDSALVIDYNGYHVGLVVDEILGMRHVPEEQVSEEPPEGTPSWLAPYVSGHAFQDGETYTIFSIRHLSESAEFLNVAA